MKTTFHSVKHNNHNYSPSNCAKTFRAKRANAAILGVMSLLGASCATTRGGNFTYNDYTGELEDFRTYKEANQMPGKITIYDAGTLQSKDSLMPVTGKKVLPADKKYLIQYYEDPNRTKLPNIFSKDYLRSINLDDWLKSNHERLIGSVIFVREDNNIVSSIIHTLSKGSSYKNEFVPAHTAVIFEKEGELKIIDIVSPKAKIKDLKDYLTKEKGKENSKYIIYLRDYDIDTQALSKSAAAFEGRKYSFYSAFQSILKKTDNEKGIHCSEVSTILLQEQGLFKTINPNKITPKTLLQLLANESAKKDFIITEAIKHDLANPNGQRLVRRNRLKRIRLHG